MQAAIITYIAKSSGSLSQSVFHKIHDMLESYEPSDKTDTELIRLREMFALPRPALRVDQRLSTTNRNHQGGWRENVQMDLEGILEGKPEIWQEVAGKSDKFFLKTVLRAVVQLFECVSGSTRICP